LLNPVSRAIRSSALNSCASGTSNKLTESSVRQGIAAHLRPQRSREIISVVRSGAAGVL
jgi:hypothetical protein